jgi:hypothetical protein
MNQQMPRSSQPGSAASNLFDLRVVIGGLFVLYGVALIVAGIVAGGVGEQMADGININLWLGIGMLAVGLLFLLWWRLQPQHRIAKAQKTPVPSTATPSSRPGLTRARTHPRSDLEATHAEE